MWGTPVFFMPIMPRWTPEGRLVIIIHKKKY